jgi:hypothetical protein
VFTAPGVEVTSASAETLLAMKLLAGDIQEGDTVEIDRGPEGLTFKRS